MKSVGELLKGARQRKKLSRQFLEARTKIKKEFIEALENSWWGKLPEYPITVGFVKSLCSALDVDENKALAILRRDFPQKSLRINPKPDSINRFSLTPATAFAGFTSIVLIAVLLYLSRQFFYFIKPPFIEVASPVDGQIVESTSLYVNGVVDPESSLSANNQPIRVNKDGSFGSELPIYEETKQIEFVVKSRSGKESVLVRKIEVIVK